MAIIQHLLLRSSEFYRIIMLRLDGRQLFMLLRTKVIMGSEQTPGYGDIRRPGHDGGDFLFVR